jgi:hypothetical protein
MKPSFPTRKPFWPLKILRGPIIVAKGVLFGLGLNLFWHYFLAVGLGWGETAPDWYFRIQYLVFQILFFLGLISWVVFYPRLERYLSRITFEKIHFLPVENKVFPLFIFPLRQAKLLTKTKRQPKRALSLKGGNNAGSQI